MNAKIISAILVLALVSLACGFNINLPQRREAGPEVEESITVADPESGEARLSLEFDTAPPLICDVEVPQRQGTHDGADQQVRQQERPVLRRK